MRSEALRDLRNCAPRSVTEDAMLCLLVCLRCCGVVDTFGGNSYWLGTRGGVSSSGLDAGRRLRVFEVVRETDDGAGLCALLFPPKKEGRREKRPVEGVELLSAMVCLYRSQLGGALPSDQGFHVSDQTLSARAGHGSARGRVLFATARAKCCCCCCWRRPREVDRGHMEQQRQTYGYTTDGARRTSVDSGHRADMRHQ